MLAIAAEFGTEVEAFFAVNAETITLLTVTVDEGTYASGRQRVAIVIEDTMNLLPGRNSG